MAEISFNKDIRPILSNKCFFCHGPSEKSRKAKLRLDLEEEAFKEKDGFAAFVRNSLEDSEAWHRITSDDPDEVMPPPKFKKRTDQGRDQHNQVVDRTRCNLGRPLGVHAGQRNQRTKNRSFPLDS